MELLLTILVVIICFLFAGAVMGIHASLRIRELESRLRFVEKWLQKRTQDGIASANLAHEEPSDPLPDTNAEENPFEEISPEKVDLYIARALSTPIGKRDSILKEEALEAALQPLPAASRDRNSAVKEGEGGYGASPLRQQALEERIGARWAVWVGGLALVLGGVFLVRYSIDAGLLTPTARILSGVALALALVGAGEWMRRKGISDEAQLAQKNAYVPGVLTLAGTTTAFASVFAAYSLYDLIGPGTAFVLFAAVALTSLVAAVLHGPAMASYGLLACYVVPFLVETDQPAMWPLTLYGIFVSLAAYGVARIRLWRWLAFATAGGAVFWGHVLAFAGVEPWDALPLALYDLAVFSMAAFVFVISLYPRGASALVERQDWPAVLVLFMHAFLILYLLQIDGFGPVSLWVLVLVGACLLVIAIEWPVAALAAISAAALVILSYLSWEVPLSPVDLQLHNAATSRIATALANPSAEYFPRVGLLLGILTGGAGLWGVLRSTGRWALSSAGVSGPLALLAIAYMRVAPFETHFYFGALFMGLATVFLAIIVVLDRRLQADGAGREAALAAYAVGTVGAIAAGMAIVLENGWLPVGLALLGAGTMWIRSKWPLAALSWVSLGVAVLACLSIAYEPTIVGREQLGRTPFFNALLYGYGVPALSFTCCAWLSGQTDQRLVRQAFEALAIFGLLVSMAVLIHHAMNGGDFYAPSDTLREWSLHTLVLLAGSLAAQRLDRLSPSPVLAFASLALSVFGFASIALLHLFAFNPLMTGENIGQGVIFNLLLVAYLLPACLCGSVALFARDKHPPWYRLAAGWLAGALAFAWITLEVRACFHLPRLDMGETTNAELYAYSAVWLLFGIALLLAGLQWRSRMIRLASAICVLAVVVKVFLFDMAGLDGAWRALSFIGLGVVLIGIGLVYQRLLTQRPPPPPQTGEHVS